MKPAHNEARSDQSNTTEARGGATGHNVRYVLGVGIAGVILAFVIVAFFFTN
jgi:hypothetical protein